MCLLLILCASTKLARRQGGGQRDVETLCLHRVVQRFPGIFKEIKYQYL